MFNADYTMERIIISEYYAKKGQNASYTPKDCPNWLNEGMNILAHLETREIEQQRKAPTNNLRTV